MIARHRTEIGGSQSLGLQRFIEGSPGAARFHHDIEVLFVDLDDGVHAAQIDGNAARLGRYIALRVGKAAAARDQGPVRIGAQANDPRQLVAVGRCDHGGYGRAAAEDVGGEELPRSVLGPHMIRVDDRSQSLHERHVVAVRGGHVRAWLGLCHCVSRPV